MRSVILQLLFICFVISPLNLYAQVIEVEEEKGVSVTERNYGVNKNLVNAVIDGRSIVLGEGEEVQRVRITEVPETHVVKNGDTLWDICDRYFNDPYVWPRVWSLNEEITNPHWIYPGQIIKLLTQSEDEQASGNTKVQREVLSKGRGLAPETVFLKNYGFIDTETIDASGKLVGSREEMELLSAFDDSYIEFNKNAEVVPGDEYTIYHETQEVYDPENEDKLLGKMVEFVGSGRVTSYDEKTHVARFIITESNQPIERGYFVASIKRNYDFIPPVRNQKNLTATIAAFLEPTNVVGDRMVVFINKGRDDGIREGNRLFVVRRRDMWRESWNEPDDNPNYPFEVIGELRVIELRAHTATCWITSSQTDLHVGDQVELRRGY